MNETELQFYFGYGSPSYQVAHKTIVALLDEQKPWWWWWRAEAEADPETLNDTMLVLAKKVKVKVIPTSYCYAIGQALGLPRPEIMTHGVLYRLVAGTFRDVLTERLSQLRASHKSQHKQLLRLTTHRCILGLQAPVRHTRIPVLGATLTPPLDAMDVEVVAAAATAGELEREQEEEEEEAMVQETTTNTYNNDDGADDMNRDPFASFPINALDVDPDAMYHAISEASFKHYDSSDPMAAAVEREVKNPAPPPAAAAAEDDEDDRSSLLCTYVYANQNRCQNFGEHRAMRSRHFFCTAHACVQCKQRKMCNGKKKCHECRINKESQEQRRQRRRREAKSSSS